MRNSGIMICLFAGLALLWAVPALAQEPTTTELPANTEEVDPEIAAEVEASTQFYASLDFSQGPGTFPVTSRAQITLPEGYDRLDAQDTARLMEYFGNPVTVEEYYVGPIDERWFAIFNYDDIGHIKDNETIDSDDMLRAIREGTEANNEARRERGWSTMSVVGWKFEPSYSSVTNRLSWAVLFDSGGEQVVNYNTRLLGRTGVMSATLVADPETLDTAVEEFEALLESFTYKPGNLYADYQEGDKLAQYGLAALVTGGAVVAVAKSKGFIKLVLGGIVAFFAFFGNRIRRIFSGNKAGD